MSDVPGNGHAKPPALKVELPTPIELRVDRLEIKTAHHDALLLANRDATEKAVREAKGHLHEMHDETKELLQQLAEETRASFVLLKGSVADLSEALGLVARDVARRKKLPAKRRRKGA
jgi:hypothetical protein